MEIESVTKYTPLLYGLMILCGALYLDVYYTVFSANIFKYLDLSEILVSFINVIITIMRLFAVILILVIIEMYALKNVFKGKLFKQGIGLKIADFFHRLILRYKKNKKIGILISTLTTASYFYFTYSNSVETVVRCYWGVALSALIINLIFIMLEFDSEAESSKRSRVAYVSVYSILALLTSTGWDAVGDAKNQIKSAKDEIVTIVTQDSTIRTTPTYYYIGRTNKCIFLYNSIDKHRDVIPAEQIKKVSFRPRTKSEAIFESTFPKR